MNLVIYSHITSSGDILSVLKTYKLYLRFPYFINYDINIQFHHITICSVTFNSSKMISRSNSQFQKNKNKK